MTKFKNGRILVFLFLASVFLLNIFKIKDTDAWMHLSLGRLIWDLRGLPAREPLMYTALDSPFFYSSWLFGVVYYLLFKAFSAYGVILFKAVTVTVAFYIMFRDSLRTYRNYAVTAIVLTGIVYISRYRFVERPDTFLMLFLSCNIFFINSYIRDNKKYIYSLPFINMVWANCHSSVNLMFVVFPAFIAGGLFQYWLGKEGRQFPDTPSLQQMKILSMVFAASFAAALINPFFIKQFFYGAGVLSSAWAKQNILELNKPVWPFNKSPYILSAVVLFTFLLNRRRFSVIHFFLVLPFLVLPFTARRFMFLMGIVSGPVIVQNISSYLNLKARDVFFSKKTVTAAVAILLICFTGAAIFMDGPLDNEKKIFGFGVNYNVIPEGALRFMDKKGITGRVFNVLNAGGYINWRDYPKRTVFVDPRFHIPESLLVKMGLAWRDPEILDELEKTYGFNSILGTYPMTIRTSLLDEIFQDKDILISNPGWALVYWDDFSLLYVKKGERYDSVVAEDGYKYIRPANFSGFNRARLHDETYRSEVIKELKRNMAETGSFKAAYLLGTLYNEVGYYTEAIDAFKGVHENAGGMRSKVYDNMAYALSNLGRNAEAIDYYKRSLELDENPATLYRLGLCLIDKGEKRAALEYLKRALDLNPALDSAYKKLISVYRELGMQEDADKVTRKYQEAINVMGREEHYRTAQQAYRNGKPDVAFAEFEQAIRLAPANPGLYSGLGYAAYDLGMLDMAYEYQRMAADTDPNFANAHYGLALIYKKWGDDNMAKKHWSEFLRLEPDGPFSSKAKEELMAIGRHVTGRSPGR